MRSSKSTCVRPGACSGRSQRCFGSISSGRTIFGSGRLFFTIPPPCAAILAASSALGETLNRLRGHLQLAARREDLVPRVAVHRDPVALALREHFTLRLAGEAHPVGPRRRAAFAQPVDELARFTLERVGGAEASRVEEDREHAVQHTLLLALVVMPGAAAG